MTLLRPLLNLVILALYLLRWALFVIARIWGSIPGGAAIVGLAILDISVHHDAPYLFYLPLVIAVLCRSLYPHLRVGRLRLLRAPAPPPAPPPIASIAQGRADDPNEATVIGRLDPKLRALLRPKPDPAVS